MPGASVARRRPGLEILVHLDGDGQSSQRASTEDRDANFHILWPGPQAVPEEAPRSGLVCATDPSAKFRAPPHPECSLMSDRRGFRLDLPVYALLAAGFLSALSVFSYDPADPPATAIYPPRQAPR